MAKSKIEKIASIEEEIRQLKERQRLLQQQHNAQERKDRTKRLCRRMGLFESLLPDTIPLTDEQFKTFLAKTVNTEQSRRILDELTAQNAANATTQGAEAAAPITDVARPFFLKQFALLEAQREQAEKEGKPYYDNDLVVAKPDGAPIAASWVSSQFGKLLDDLDMPHIRFHDLRHSAATNMHQLTGDFYTVGEVLGHTLAGIGASLGLSMNFEAVTARYVDVRLERKKEVLDTYHSAVKQTDTAEKEASAEKKEKSPTRKRSSDISL